MNRIEGKTIIVTGGSVGIGRAICLILAKEGACVAVTDVPQDEGRKLVAEITEADGDFGRYASKAPEADLNITPCRKN